VWAILHLRPYLEGQKFIIRTDYHSLRWVLNLSDARGKPLSSAICHRNRCLLLTRSVLRFYTRPFSHYLVSREPLPWTQMPLIINWDVVSYKSNRMEHKNRSVTGVAV
jgi:hypothetical protein